MYSRQKIKSIIDSISIVDTISGYCNLKKQSSSWVCCCPFHEEKTPSFRVSDEKKFFYCFGCGKRGDVIEFYSLMTGANFIESLNHMAKICGINIDDQYFHHETDVLIYYLKKAADEYHSNLDEKSIQYFIDIGLNESVIREFLLGFAKIKPPEVDELFRCGIVNKDGRHIFMNRFMFPISDWRGYVLGFAGKDSNGRMQAKYINSAQTELFCKKNLLYGLHIAIKYIRIHGSVILVEGYTDVLMMHSNGIKNCVASMGTSVTKEQINIMFKYTDNIILMMDGDSAGVEATKKAFIQVSKQIQGRKNLQVVLLDGGNDPAESIRKYGVRRMSVMIDNPIKFHEYLLQHIHSEDKNTPEGMNKIIFNSIAITDEMPESTFKRLIKKEISNFSGVTIYPTNKIFNTSEYNSKRSLYDEIIVSIISNPEILLKTEIKERIINIYNYDNSIKNILDMFNEGINIDLIDKEIFKNSFYSDINSNDAIELVGSCLDIIENKQKKISSHNDIYNIFKGE